MQNVVVREVTSSIPVVFFFFVPSSCHVDQFTFHISLPRLKFTISVHLSHLDFGGLRHVNT